MMYMVAAVIIGYLIGCVNGSQMVSKYKHINIKNDGSRNAGATNTALLVGFKYGVLVALVDVFKAIISLYIVVVLIEYTALPFEFQVILLYINAMGIVIGHNFPIHMHFKGGKGTASFLGILLFFDWRFTMMAFVIFVLFALVSNYFVVGTFMAYISFIAYTAYTFGKAPTYIAFLLIILFLVKHRDNVKRIMHKEERKLTSLFHREAG